MQRCRHFSGYKPCSLNLACDPSCASYDEVSQNILIVHLGAIGAVLRSTSLLAAINQKYKNARIHWLTQKPCDDLLRSHPMIDRVWLNQFSDWVQLKPLRFQAALVIDKDLSAIGFIRDLDVKEVFGFTADSVSGGIIPANAEAHELWRLGLSNHDKFFINKKTEVQLTHESLGLGEYKRNEYNLPLSQSEARLAQQRKTEWSVHNQFVLIGLNTRCSQTLPQKKIAVEQWIQIADGIIKHFLNLHIQIRIVLLGGKEDHQRNLDIAISSRATVPGTELVIQSPSQNGLRDGLVSVAACDLIVTGDSLGMHMAIAQQKPVVAWFGPTCAHEIEFYDRAEVIKSEHPCAPCWNRHCMVENKCNEQVNLPQFIKACDKLIKRFYPRLTPENQALDL
jgi:heptosyltransferase-2